MQTITDAFGSRLDGAAVAFRPVDGSASIGYGLFDQWVQQSWMPCRRPARMAAAALPS